MRFLTPLRSGKPVSLLGDFETLHSYTNIEDFGNALALAANVSDSRARAWMDPRGPAEALISTG